LSNESTAATETAYFVSFRSLESNAVSTTTRLPVFPPSSAQRYFASGRTGAPPSDCDGTSTDELHCALPRGYGLGALGAGGVDRLGVLSGVERGAGVGADLDLSGGRRRGRRAVVAVDAYTTLVGDPGLADGVERDDEARVAGEHLEARERGGALRLHLDVDLIGGTDRVRPGALEPHEIKAEGRQRDPGAHGRIARRVDHVRARAPLDDVADGDANRAGLRDREVAERAPALLGRPRARCDGLAVLLPGPDLERLVRVAARRHVVDLEHLVRQAVGVVDGLGVDLAFGHGLSVRGEAEERLLVADRDGLCLSGARGEEDAEQREARRKGAKSRHRAAFSIARATRKPS
jgi:hypothetical protein